MKITLVYVGYMCKQCVKFADGISEKLSKSKEEFTYDKQHLTIESKLFKLFALPIYSGNLNCLGMENAEYICQESVYPVDYKPSPEEHLKIQHILEFISTRFRNRPEEKTEKELEELIDSLIGEMKNE